MASSAYYILILSCFVYLGVVFGLVLLGQTARYWPEIITFLLMTFFSAAHHICDHDISQCSSNSPDVLLGYDTLFAFLAMNAGVSPFVDWRYRAHSGLLGRSREIYMVSMTLLTVVLVTFFANAGDQYWVPATVLPAINLFVLAYVLIAKKPREEARPVERIQPCCCCGLYEGKVIAGFVMTGLGMLFNLLERKPDVDDLSINYMVFHSLWHLCIGMGGLIFISLLPSEDEENAAIANVVENHPLAKTAGRMRGTAAAASR
jgi:hypothetical protein